MENQQNRRTTTVTQRSRGQGDATRRRRTCRRLLHTNADFESAGEGAAPALHWPLRGGQRQYVHSEGPVVVVRGRELQVTASVTFDLSAAAAAAAEKR
jgi:hypothetical protein